LIVSKNHDFYQPWLIHKLVFCICQFDTSLKYVCSNHPSDEKLKFSKFFFNYTAVKVLAQENTTQPIHTCTHTHVNILPGCKEKQNK